VPFPFSFRLVPAASALAAAGFQNPTLPLIQELQTKATNYFNSIPRPNVLRGQGVSARRRQYRRDLAKQLYFGTKPAETNP
jgi:hypothetical protein